MVPLLRLEGLRRHFDGVRALDDVSFDVPEGAVFGLIGPNGAGKTTLVNVVTGYIGAQAGQARLGGVELTGLPVHRIATLGVARTFQTIRLYRTLTVLDNVLVGMHVHHPSDLLERLLPWPGGSRARRQRISEAHHLLARAGVPERLAQRPAGTLSYGDQRRLEVARALALRPRLLILDEPAAGMNPTEKDRIRDLIESLNSDGLTILLIDHDMRLVMGVCRRIAVLNFGRRIAEGTPAEVAAEPEVISAYLGTHAAEEGAKHVPVGETDALEAGTGTEPAPPRTPTGPGLLEISKLTVAHGAVAAVREVSLRVEPGEIVALIGANGAGKTTILRTLSGLLRPQAGSAAFRGLDLGRASPARIVRQGLIHVPEGREVLATQTVLENLELGAWSRRDAGAARTEIAGLMDRFPILGQRRNTLAGQLSGGEQQILAIARALVAHPRLLLLDEPSLGLAPRMVDTVFEMIEEIHRQGTPVLLVEQNALRALEVADRGYVIETGRILLTGTGAELLQDPEVRRAYLGG